MSEYLRAFRTQRIEGVTVPHLLETGQILTAHTLSLELQDAYRYLTTAPGPHLANRQESAAGWLPWWINYLNSLPREEGVLQSSPKIHRHDAIPASDAVSGALFVAGAEGHEGHRFASYWMKQHVDRTILMFEEDQYLQEKKRGWSFLPLEVRLSMWAHHPDVDIVSVTPYPDRGAFPDLNAYYQHMFDGTHADYCFATEDDPNEQSKRSRGKEAEFTRIPVLPVQSTSERVIKLLPDAIEDLDEEHEDILFMMEYFSFPWETYERFRENDGRYRDQDSP